MSTRRCAVCGKIDKASKFGNGIRCPKTTCLNCKKLALEYTEAKVIMFVKNIVREVS